MHPQYGWSRQQQPAAASAPPSLDPYADQRYDANTYATHAHDARTTAGHSSLSNIYADQTYTPRQADGLSNIYADQTYTPRPDGNGTRGGVARDTVPATDGAERFQVTLVPSDTSEPESVYLQVGLDGVQVQDEHTRKTLRTYALDAISRWAMPDASVLTFWHKPPGGTEQAVRVMATERTNRSLLDTLTCSCLQLCEMRGVPFSSVDDSGRNEHVNMLASAAGSARPAPDDKAGDKGVEFWTAPEREGWLMKQGEHIKTWRRRWFVLKQGRIFWFKEHRLTPQSCSRGVVRLSCVQEVRSTADPKFQKHTFELVMTSGPAQFFTADTEAEKQAWMAELERKRLALHSNSHEAASELLKRDFEQLRGGY